MLLIFYLFGIVHGNIFNLDLSVHAWISLEQEIYLEITPDISNGYAWIVTEASSEELIIKEESDMILSTLLNVPIVTQVFSVSCTEKCKNGDTVQLSFALIGSDSLPIETREIFIQISNQRMFLTKQVAISYNDSNNNNFIHVFIANGHIREMIKINDKWSDGKLDVKGNDISAISFSGDFGIIIKAYISDGHQITEWLYTGNEWKRGNFVYSGVSSSLVSWNDKINDELRAYLFITQHDNNVVEFMWDRKKWIFEEIII
ncbi:unnamed protein product [Blepharisma stoltei]|uniref:Galectin n=1 Tax=Blepharisma stoltei TaxID=1481888 RepID=A0AAU9JCA7_9CILI|nr:unnamed protein product [Blepharisma stoltei]